MSSNFELPIYYLENKEKLDENIKEDLEFSLIEYERNLNKYNEIFGDFEK